MKIDENSKVPYYLQAKELIIGMLRTGHVRPGEKFPTVRELAKRFHIGLVTAHKAVSELKQEGLLCSRPKKGIFISEQAAARLARQTPAPALGIVLSESTFQRRNSFYLQEIFDGLAAAAKQDPFEMHILLAPSDPEALAAFCESLKDKQISGLLLASRGPVQVVLELMSRKIPFVWINNDLAHERIHSVMVDDVQAMMLTLNHLKACGYRRVGLINYWWSAETFAAYRDLLRDKGFEADSELIKSGAGVTLEEEQRQAGLHVRELMTLARPPEALFLWGEGTISGAYKALQELNLAVPGGVGLIGCAQQTYAEHFPLPLTYTMYPNRAMAETAARMLWQLIRARPVMPEKVILVPELVIGRTCREINS